ncbi:hypothetical protein JTB14_038209 [Gonioctena quinquepunctata]|nr:hypothetical protein JTB14_038209 [Gonioctena quinquepunctata]
MPVTIMAKNYSHCPLKKRPIVYDDIPDEPKTSPPNPRTEQNRKPGLTSPPSSPRCLLGIPQSSITDSPPASPPMSSPSPTHSCTSPPSKWNHVWSTRCQSAQSTLHKPGTEAWRLPCTTQHTTITCRTLTTTRASTWVPRRLTATVPCRPSQMQQPLQPLALRPTVYSSMDQSSLSPNSSTTSPPPQTVPSAEDLSEKRRQGIRHQCPDCGKSYSTFSGLSKHRQFHCAAGDGPKKSFSCKYCEKIYVSLGALKMHIRTHTLPCKCTICGKAFSRPWLLQGHIRTHTGEKPFSCTYCNRAFADRSNLRAHLQTHSDVKKYSCGTCSKTFSRMSLLTKHTEGGCTLMHMEKMC